MLGESHSLIHELPKFKNIILSLNTTDKVFAAEAARYHTLDTEIRRLELDSAPIDDQSMFQLKHERSQLKDRLYQHIQQAHN